MKFLRLCVYLLGVGIMCSCSSAYYMRRGDMMYESGRFYKSTIKYNKAYQKTKAKGVQAEAAMRSGHACENINRLKEAYSWYRRAERADKELPGIYLKVAQVSADMGDYETATEYYNRYEELFGDGKGQDGLYRLEQIYRDSSAQGRYVVETRKDFNSRYGDFAPAYCSGDTCIVYLASNRPDNPKKKRAKTDPVTGERYNHLFVANYVQEIKTIDKQGRVKVKHFKEPRWLTPVLVRDSLYSSQDEGGICFSADGNTLYFTSSRLVKGQPVGTRIYKAAKGTVKKDNGEEEKGWMSVSASGICGDSVSVGHPALTPDGSRMYFVSDMLPGGMGGKDIWYVDNQNGKWGKPVNAGELVNTPGDELFPYVRDNGELYFASDGHYGLGGLDIYKVAEKEGKLELVHLPAPLNSFADDFGIVYKPGQEDGLLSSSRSGRSDDIYGFKFLPQQLQVRMLARNAITEAPINGVEVKVTCDDGNEFYLETDSAGVAQMVVVADKEYVFVTENQRYLKGKGTVSTYREKNNRMYELTVDMQPIEKPIVIPNIYFDVAKWELRLDAKENLRELLTILKDNPNIVIELSAHTDMVGNDQANMSLSDNRAQAVVDYLIEKEIYWDRLEAKGYGETQPRQINEKDVKEYPFLKAGDVLNERFVNRLKGQQKEDAMQLNRRIEFKVLRTNYKPGPNSLHNPNRKAVAVEEGEIVKLGTTQLRDLKTVKGNFFTLQLGVFRNVPALINQFKVVFTEKVKDGAVRYCTGIYDTRTEADEAAKKLKEKGVDCMVREYK